jgi:hypothetical protein
MLVFEIAVMITSLAVNSCNGLEATPQMITLLPAPQHRSYHRDPSQGN